MLPEPRRIGERLWRAAPLRALPDSSFFPRSAYAAVALSSGECAFVLGGLGAKNSMNDVWELRLSVADGGTWHWTEVSPHETGQREDLGTRLVLSKWSGRSQLAAAVAAPRISSFPPPAIYVTGGVGSGSTARAPEDFWASDNGGRTWYCMCQKVPWGRRLDPSLAVVPMRYERLVLVGGAKPSPFGLQLSADVWISDDAGANWCSVQAPSWEPRGAPLLFFAPPTARQKRVLLILGGCRQLEGSSGDRAHASGSRYLDDAWEAEIDFSVREARWRELGQQSVCDDFGVRSWRNGDGACDGFDGRVAAFEPSALPHRHGTEVAALREGGEELWPRNGGLVCLRRGETFCARPAAPRSWAPCGLLDAAGSASCMCDDVEAPIEHVALAAGPKAACPRLLVFSCVGIACTGAGEVAWQRRFLHRVGQYMEAGPVGFPLVLWLARVVPSLLPQPQQAQRRQLVPPQPLRAT